MIRMPAAALAVCMLMFAANAALRASAQSVQVAGPASTTASRELAARRVPLEGAINFRDLGGYQTADGRRVKWKMLYRSDALDSLTPEDWRALESLDIARITDFRSERETRRLPDRLPPFLEGRRHHLPLDYLPKTASGSAATDPSISKLASEKTLAEYEQMFMSVYPRFVRETSAEYGAWLESLLEGPPQSAHLFHCMGGADRTGFASAVLLLALGVPRDAVTQDYLLTNQSLYSPAARATFAKRIGKLPEGVQLHARYLDAALDTITTEYGSFDNYLRRGLGMDDAALARLREKFLESSK